MSRSRSREFWKVGVGVEYFTSDSTTLVCRDATPIKRIRYEYHLHLLTLRHEQHEQTSHGLRTTHTIGYSDVTKDACVDSQTPLSVGHKTSPTVSLSHAVHRQWSWRTSIFTSQSYHLDVTDSTGWHVTEYRAITWCRSSSMWNRMANRSPLSSQTIEWTQSLAEENVVMI